MPASAPPPDEQHRQHEQHAKRTSDGSPGSGKRDGGVVGRMQKAIAILQFKLEGQTIERHPEWNMDDRNIILTGRVIKYQFPQRGDYFVKLTVTNALGNKVSVTKQIDVLARQQQ